MNTVFRLSPGQTIRQHTGDQGIAMIRMDVSLAARSEA